MSRYSEGDGCEEFPNQGAFFERNARAALKGKRGRKALAELRDALMALPEKRLISRAVCTVAPDARRQDENPRMVPDPFGEGMRDANRWAHISNAELNEIVESEGEGVCAVGAYVWWREVKRGTDPTEAFAKLPTMPDFDADLSETAQLGQDEGLVYLLAWELAYRNDETFEACTPEQRWQRFVAWIDSELAETAAAR